MLATIGPDNSYSSAAAWNSDFLKMLPQSTLEISLWIALSASAGFCEEIVYRRIPSSGNFSRYGKACHSPYLYRP